MANRKGGAMWVICGLTLGLSGCFGPPNVPEELEVVLPNNVRRTAPANSGPAAFENSTWAVFLNPDAEVPTGDTSATPGPYGGFLTGGVGTLPSAETRLYFIHFGDGGRIERVSDNKISPEIIGDELIIDGAFHSQRLPGLTYAAVSFGVSEGDQFGVAFPMDLRFFGVPIGTVIVYAWGTRTEERVDGILGRLFDFSLPEFIVHSGGDQFPIFATP